jgi:hypothetical protein
MIKVSAEAAEIYGSARQLASEKFGSEAALREMCASRHEGFEPESPVQRIWAAGRHQGSALAESLVFHYRKLEFRSMSCKVAV